MSLPSTRHLVIMAKLPQAGRVKTRLAAGLGFSAAAGFYRTELRAALRRLGHDPRWRTWLAITPDWAVGAPVWPRKVTQLAQGPGGLGTRMGRLMTGLPPGSGIIVGSDIPDLRPAHIAGAFGLLGSHDAVFGPATDGGYYLVGLKRLPRTLNPFAGVRWSGPHALADTLANLGGRKIGFVDTLADIDTAEDLRDYRQSKIRAGSLVGSPE